jgi:hypothetical protein
LFGEGARTNLALNSGAIISNLGWTGNLVPSASGLGPDGNTAYLLSETNSTAIQTIANTGSVGSSQGTPVVSGTTYTGSIFLKKVGGNIDWIQLTFGQSGFGPTQYANFNISNGTVGNFSGTASGAFPRIEAYANGWYRCSISVVATATTQTNNLIVVGIQNTNGTTRIPTYAGNPANGLLAGLIQFEAGLAATSYIPTGSSAAIRSSEVCNISGAAFLGMFNPTAGTLFTSVLFNESLVSASAQVVVDVNDGTTNNRLRYFRGNAGASGLINTASGTTNVNLSGGSLATGTTHRFAAMYSLDDFAFYVNGNLVGEDAVGNVVVSPTTMTIGDSSAGAGRIPLNGIISSIRYYRRRSPNAKGRALTL